MALNLKDSHRGETKHTRSGSMYRIYFFRCSLCENEIRSQHNYLSKHSGLCTSCAHKGATEFSAPYGHMHRAAAKAGIKVMTESEYAWLRDVTTDCHYCEAPIVATPRGYCVDRKNPSGPYTLQNSVVCCWSCNQAKGRRYTYGEFMEISDLINARRKRYSK